jgi:long-chain acyl-CoA synthetase
VTAFLVHHLLDATAATAPDREALVTAEQRLTWRELAAGAWRAARLFADLGVRRGDRVAILAHNGVEYATAYYGALAAGAIAVPLNTAADPGSLASCVADAGASVVVCGRRLERVVVQAAPRLELRAVVIDGAAHDALAAAAPRLATILPAAIDAQPATPPGVSIVDLDPASIIYTSGSTGRPRGATLTHLNLMTNIRSIVDYLGVSADDRVLAVLPFHYVYGKSVLNTAVAVGATVVVDNRFQYPNVALDTLERERCTGLAGVPSTFAILMDRSNFAERALPDLRWVTQAGGGMSPTLTRRVLAALRGRALWVMYGATEASARLSCLAPDQLPTRIGSIGRAIPNVELTVRRPDGTECDDDEVGELTARGANVMVGYWNDPDETARALGPHGYRTGDLARRDRDGYLWLIGRNKDMLKVGGHRVAAREIEDAILEHPGVSEVAVLGVADELLGDRLRAFVVLRAAGVVDAAGIGRFLRERLPAYKIPSDIEIRDDLPRNAAGKVMKEALRDG